VAPTGVDGIFVGVTPAAEALEVDVSDSAGAKLGRQGFSIELRNIPGARDAAHIDDALNTVGFEDGDKLIKAVRRVADGKNSEFGSLGRSGLGCGTHRKYVYVVLSRFTGF